MEAINKTELNWIEYTTSLFQNLQHTPQEKALSRNIKSYQVVWSDTGIFEMIMEVSMDDKTVLPLNPVSEEFLSEKHLELTAENRSDECLCIRLQ